MNCRTWNTASVWVHYDYNCYHNGTFWFILLFISNTILEFVQSELDFFFFLTKWTRSYSIHKLTFLITMWGLFSWPSFVQLMKLLMTFPKCVILSSDKLQDQHYQWSIVDSDWKTCMYCKPSNFHVRLISRRTNFYIFAPIYHNNASGQWMNDYTLCKIKIAILRPLKAKFVKTRNSLKWMDVNSFWVYSITVAVV